MTNVEFERYARQAWNRALNRRPTPSSSITLGWIIEAARAEGVKLTIIEAGILMDRMVAEGRASHDKFFGCNAGFTIL